MTTETAPADRITLPGGEMLAWSDLPQERLANGGPLAALTARLVPRGARVLLAGPHDPALLDQLTHAEVTCLLRSHPEMTATVCMLVFPPDRRSPSAPVRPPLGHRRPPSCKSTVLS